MIIVHGSAGQRLYLVSLGLWLILLFPIHSFLNYVYNAVILAYGRFVIHFIMFILLAI